MAVSEQLMNEQAEIAALKKDFAERQERYQKEIETFYTKHETSVAATTRRAEHIISNLETVASQVEIDSHAHLSLFFSFSTKGEGGAGGKKTVMSREGIIGFETNTFLSTQNTVSVLLWKGELDTLSDQSIQIVCRNRVLNNEVTSLRAASQKLAVLLEKLEKDNMDLVFRNVEVDWNLMVWDGASEDGDEVGEEEEKEDEDRTWNVDEFLQFLDDDESDLGLGTEDDSETSDEDGESGDDQDIKTQTPTHETRRSGDVTVDDKCHGFNSDVLAEQTATGAHEDLVGKEDHELEAKTDFPIFPNQGLSITSSASPQSIVDNVEGESTDEGTPGESHGYDAWERAKMRSSKFAHMKRQRRKAARERPNRFARNAESRLANHPAMQISGSVNEDRQGDWQAPSSLAPRLVGMSTADRMTGNSGGVVAPPKTSDVTSPLVKAERANAPKYALHVQPGSAPGRDGMRPKAKDIQLPPATCQPQLQLLNNNNQARPGRTSLPASAIIALAAVAADKEEPNEFDGAATKLLDFELAARRSRAGRKDALGVQGGAIRVQPLDGRTAGSVKYLSPLVR
ncbi:hypothetical protein HK102_003068 [Quaeritorhiza haematococci]|nr:hypothetical protein HK102_003068 [Quaeritorhiza haematococci]